MNKNILFFTRTFWNEPPRIRHQTARLLNNNGFNIYFFEKNNYSSLKPKTRREENITFYSHAEFIHHQLRYFPIIQKINSWIVKRYIKSIAKNLEFEYILNFNYDYTFLRDLFPDKKIITLINDDFENMAKFGMKKQVLKQMGKTCSISDHVLTVSYPIYDKLKVYNNKIDLLFPWAQNTYKTPIKNQNRDTVLYFGYVGRLDWNKLESLIKDNKYKFRFIGPGIKGHDTERMHKYEKDFSNFEYIPYSNLDDLKTDDVFCSILPYDASNQGIQACTISNRALNLLSLGLPLAYADLKYLIKAPDTIIRKNISTDDYRQTLDFFYNNYDSSQADIKNFLRNHYKENRLDILNNTFKMKN